MSDWNEEETYKKIEPLIERITRMAVDAGIPFTMTFVVGRKGDDAVYRNTGNVPPVRSPRGLIQVAEFLRGPSERPVIPSRPV